MNCYIRPLCMLGVLSVAIYGASSMDAPPDGADAEASDSPRTATSEHSSDEVEANDLTAAVSQINQRLANEYGLLDPMPLTVPRVRDAIEAASTQVAESDMPDRLTIVSQLQRVLSTGVLPEDVELQLVPMTTNYKKGSALGKKAISLNYVLSVPTPAAKSDKQLLGLKELLEIYRIVQVEPKD